MGNKYNSIILILIVISCTNPFAPKLTDSDQVSSSFLTNQKNPKDVLSNFRYAYIFKDSLIYSEIIDSSFIFISKNYATTPPTDLIWGRDVDLNTTAKLFRHFRDIKLIWGDTLTSQRDSSSAQIQLPFLLTFDDGRDIPTVKGVALFNFKKENIRDMEYSSLGGIINLRFLIINMNKDIIHFKYIRFTKNMVIFAFKNYNFQSLRRNNE